MKERYVTLKEAAEKLGVARGTLHYYLVHLKIERKRFPLDKHVYILASDLERIQTLRREAIERSGPPTDPRIPIVDEAA